MQTYEERKPVLLFIEDDDHTREKWTREFAQNNFRLFRVVTASNIREATEIIEKEKISVVITDLMWGDGALGEYFEPFLGYCVDKEIATVLMTGAEWGARPDIPWVRIVEKPADPEKVYAQICLAQGEISKKKAERCKELKIVIIEDYERTREELNIMFARDGFENVGLYHSVDEAKKHMGKEAPDIIITDIYAVSFGHPLEDFIKMWIEQGIKVIVHTGAEWNEVPMVDGIRILKKPADWNVILDAIDDARNEIESQKIRAPPNKQKLKLVYIEDDAHHRRLATAKFKRNGIDVVAACSDLSEAFEVISREKIDAVVTDIYDIEYGKQTLEDFLSDCTSKNIAVVLYTRAFWVNPPEIKGIRMVLKPGFDGIYGAIEEARIELESARARKRMTKETEEAIHRLANPEWHLSSPTIKWLVRIFENPDSAVIDKTAAMLSLETDVLRKELREGIGNGNWPRRDMDACFDRYRELTGKLRALKRKTETAGNSMRKRATV